MSNKVGRPLKIDSVEELQILVNSYFEETPIEDITITGLCLHLGVTKETFYEYTRREEYRNILNIARLRVENAYEISLRRNGRTGDIFALKNFGWKDQVENKVEHSIDNITPLINMLMVEEEQENE